MRISLLASVLWFWLPQSAAPDDSDLLKARDHQDRAALEKMAAEARAAADKQPNDAAAQYKVRAGGILFGRSRHRTA